MEDFESRSSLKPTHVYISYRGGDDTRRFIKSLSGALEAQGFRIVGDDKSREIPDMAFPDELLRAMRESWILILVLSKSYVSSSWCLEELSQVVGRLFLKEKPKWSFKRGYGFIPNRAERNEEDLDELIKRWWQHMKQPADLCGRSNNADRIIPVFYDVDSKSFAQHMQESFPGNLFEEAMQKVTNLSGWDLQYESRSQVIPKIVKEVKSKIDKLFYGFFRYVGMKSRVEEVEQILDLSSDDEVQGIKLLIQKSLITIANQGIQMHGMSQAMGREIVRQECPNQPEKRRRLYLFNDIKYVMEKERNMVIKNVEAIVLDLEEPKGVTLRIEALSQMINLRLLIFRNVHFSGTLDNLSSKLQHVSWHQYPFTSLPSSFQSDTLVQLIMPDSNVTEVWKGKMMLLKLRKMNLCGSKTLIKTPDFGGVPNLERLDLEGCTGLLELDPSIAELSKLKFLNLRNCINLISIPNRLFALYSLEILNLAGCSEFAHCLNFSPLKSLTEVKLLSIWSNPFLESILYFLLYVLTKKLW
ncbi:disease resistance protein RPV1-like isoform X2 [Prosopis cineraria]|uniref:disease resistance protein RPV1-like isoform X2 n=1 Tax=Prosopis cineraria TaxID=364024 RepID=UPI0024108FFD|nr:disease resistance protein RPV1-like isoform X2 [Prosopis cineraria]